MGQCQHDLTAAWQLLREMHYSNEAVVPDWQAEHRYRYMGGLEMFAVITGQDVATVMRRMYADLEATND